MKRNCLISIICSGVFVLNSAADELPKGVPPPLDAEGRYTDAIMFTTKEYQREAFRLIIQEANSVAMDLALLEKLPITESNVTAAFITPFGDAYVNHRLGNIRTTNYTYGVELSNKFSFLCINNLDERCISYKR